MTAAAAILAACAERDIVLFLDAGRLRYSAPPGVLTDADRETIAEHRPELLALLASAEPGPGPTAAPVAEPAAPPEPVSHCPGCGSPSWWLAADGWQCSRCCPYPQPFTGTSHVVDSGCWRAGTHPPVPEPTTADDLIALHGETVAGCRTADVLEQADDGDLPELRDPAAPRPPRPDDGRTPDEFGARRTPDQHDAIRAFGRHHWRCHTCQRAGRGYGSRCPTGERLHAACRLPGGGA